MDAALNFVKRFMKQFSPAMGKLITGILLICFFGRAILTAADVPTVQDPDRALPDAPFQLEQGWRALLNGYDLSGWKTVPGGGGDTSRLDEWFRSSSVSWSRLGSPTRLSAKSGPGPILVNGIASQTTNLVSQEAFGDIELYLEFLISKGSNSGVYLHSLYEVQIFDSWGADTAMTSGDGGGIYERWENNHGFGGSAPLVNACRRPGEWQSYHIWFRAPRFDGARKTADAEFVKVVYNGIVVQRNFRCGGPTRAALEKPEAPVNPIMLQGDHGPVAFRNIYVRALRDPDAASSAR
jgi:hypothetical protein